MWLQVPLHGLLIMCLHCTCINYVASFCACSHDAKFVWHSHFRQCTPTPRCQRTVFLFAKFLVPRVEVILRDVWYLYQGDQNLVCVLTLSTRTVMNNSSYQTGCFLHIAIAHTHTHTHTHRLDTVDLLDVYSFHLDFKTEIKQVQRMWEH